MLDLMQLHNEKGNACGVELDFSPLGNKYIDTCHKGLLSKMKSRFFQINVIRR